VVVFGLLCSSAYAAQPAQPEAVDCTVCQFVIGYVDQLLESNYSVSNIVRVLDTVCDIVPSGLRAECDDLISTYAPQIIQLLVNEASPEEVCSAIGLCTSLKIVFVPPTDKASELCVICEFVMSTAEEYLTGNETEHEIILFVENVCFLLPKTVRSECDDLIATYGPEIIELLVQKEPPAVICTQISLCSAAKKTIPAFPVMPVGAPKESIECMLCQYIIGAAEEYATSNSTEQDVLRFLDGLCQDLPSEYSSQCVSFVNYYGPIVVDDIINDEPPPQVCTGIKMCGNSAVTILVQE